MAMLALRPGEMDFLVLLFGILATSLIFAFAMVLIVLFVSAHLVRREVQAVDLERGRHGPPKSDQVRQTCLTIAVSTYS